MYCFSIRCCCCCLSEHVSHLLPKGNGATKHYSIKNTDNLLFSEAIYIFFSIKYNIKQSFIASPSKKGLEKKLAKSLKRIEMSTHFGLSEALWLWTWCWRWSLCKFGQRSTEDLYSLLKRTFDLRQLARRRKCGRRKHNTAILSTSLV